MPKPTPGPGRGSRSLRRAGFALAGVLTLALGVLSTAAVAYIEYAGSQLETVDIPGLDEEDPPPRREVEDEVESELARGVTNILLVGSDSREALSEDFQEDVGDADVIGGQRSDTLILLHLDPGKEKAVLVHFPRDLRVEIPGVGTDRINTAYNTGGPELAIKTVKRFTGLKIHHYVEVNFQGFKRLVASVDGVEVCIDRPMIDEKAGLRLPEKGCYRLGAHKALAFVRARNVAGDIIPDFARIARQQQFIRALVNKVLTVRSLLNPSVIKAAARNVTMSDTLQLFDLYYIAQRLKDMGAEGESQAVDFRLVPSVPQNIDGTSFVVPVEPDAADFFARLKRGDQLGQLGAKPPLTPPSPATIRVSVMDAGNAKRARKARGRLQKAGFALQGIFPAPVGQEPRTIIYRPDRRAEAEVVQGFFPSFELVEVPKDVLPRAEVAVVVGPKGAGGGS